MRRWWVMIMNAVIQCITARYHAPAHVDTQQHWYYKCMFRLLFQRMCSMLVPSASRQAGRSTGKSPTLSRKGELLNELQRRKDNTCTCADNWITGRNPNSDRYLWWDHHQKIRTSYIASQSHQAFEYDRNDFLINVNAWIDPICIGIRLNSIESKKEKVILNAYRLWQFHIIMKFDMKRRQISDDV